MLTTCAPSAIAAATVAIWVAGKRERFGAAGVPVVVALALTAVWSLVLAGQFSPFFAILSESARNLSWLYVLYRLFAGDGRHTSLAPIRPVVIALRMASVSSAGETICKPVRAATCGVKSRLFRVTR